MYSIQFLPHTSDIRIRLEADSLSELFWGGIKSMNQVIAPQACSGVSEDLSYTRTVSLVSGDATSLLIDFLSEVLTITLSEKVIFCNWRVQLLENTSLQVELWGTLVHHFEEEIKAVTYHEAEVRQLPDGMWESYVIFDI